MHFLSNQVSSSECNFSSTKHILAKVTMEH